jgi:hypothetical protein
MAGVYVSFCFAINRTINLLRRILNKLKQHTKARNIETVCFGFRIFTFRIMVSNRRKEVMSSQLASYRVFMRFFENPKKLSKSSQSQY